MRTANNVGLPSLDVSESYSEDKGMETFHIDVSLPYTFSVGILRY